MNLTLPPVSSSLPDLRRAVPGTLGDVSEDVVADIGAWRNDYTGPTGAQSALQVLLGEADIPTVALWAQVPHYVAAGPSPSGVRLTEG